MTGSGLPAAPPRVRLPRTVEDIGAVDTRPFIEVLDRFSERFWSAEDAEKANDFDVLRQTQHVILRFLLDQDDARSSYAQPAWKVIGPLLEPSMRAIVEPYGFGDPQYTKAMFARLAPFSDIARHRDQERSNHVTHKIHVPLRTHPDVEFEVAGEFTHLAVGRAYEVNNVRPHGVRNPTGEPRVHFIFEVFDGAT